MVGTGAACADDIVPSAATVPRNPAIFLSMMISFQSASLDANFRSERSFLMCMERVCARRPCASLPMCSQEASRFRRADLPDGLIFRIPVNPSVEKYFALSEDGITCMPHPVPHPSEGRIAIVTDVGCGMRWTLWLRETSATEADGKDAWSWHPDAGVKSCGRSARRRRLTSPDSGESAP